MAGLVGRVRVWLRMAAAVVIAVAGTWLVVAWQAGPKAPFIDVATGVSAVGTCAAAVVVAWQAFMTRQAVQAAKESADLSRELTVEAVKTRLDSRAPFTSLVMLDPAQWPPYEPSNFGEAQPIQLGRQYRMPKDAEEQIQVRAYARFTNHSEKSLVITLSDVVPEGWNQQARPPQRVTVEAGRDVSLFVIQTRTVAEWIEVAEARRAQQHIETVGQVYYSDDYDDGVLDRWTARLAGSPLRPVEGLGSTWELLPKPNADPSGFEIVQCVVTGMERTYFLSKSRGVRLPPVTDQSEGSA